MNKKQYTSLALTAGLSLPALATEPTYEEIFDKVWGEAMLYESDSNMFIQDLAFTGRLQYDYANFDDDDLGSVSETQWRRARAGFKATVFEDYTVHVEADLDLENTDPVYNRLTEAYIGSKLSDQWSYKVGKQSAPFTLDGATSSKRLITAERSKLTNNTWFTSEYFTGVTSKYKTGQWTLLGGVFSNDDGDEFDDVFDEKYFYLGSVSYNFNDRLDLDNALVKFDIVYNDESDEMGTNDNEQVYSLSTQWDKGQYHLWTDLAYAETFDSNHIWGFSVMPFYDINDTFQVVGRYTYVTSSDANGVSLSRYEKDLVSARGDEVHELYAGVNTYLYGHKLKWQNGIQYTDAHDDSNSGGDYRGWGFTSAIRMYW